MFKFRVLGVPVGVEAWFWLATLLLGGGLQAHSPEDWEEVAVWTGVVFVSILVHELGHALVGRHFGASPSIRLHGFGGVTFLPGPRLSRSQNTLVSAAGPLAGLLLGLVTLVLRKAPTDLPPLANLAIRDALYVNFVWTAINLLPIQPLDGGQILTQVLGPRRFGLVSWIGAGVATATCLWAFSRGQLFSAMMLAMLAFYNFRREPVAGGVIAP